MKKIPDKISQTFATRMKVAKISSVEQRQAAQSVKVYFDIVGKNNEKKNLVTKLLYGCGLRLFECLNLRMNCLNLDDRILTVHDGKGQKDRLIWI
jgi:site-specific recombinase XerD